MIPDLAQLRRKGALSALDDHFARSLGRLADEERPEVLLAVGLASRNVGEGHVCLDLRRWGQRPGLLAEPGDEAWAWPEADAWIGQLETSEIVESLAPASGAASRPSAPLVLDGAGRLYLRRYWDDQQSLAGALRRRMEGEIAVDEAVLADGLERLFPGDAQDLAPDLQRQAAEAAVRARFFVISGGPGTGKTHTVVGLLALLIEQSLAKGEPPPRMRMVTPTGKAAAHLQAAVQRSRDSLACPEAVRAAVPTTASTIHRCLGSRGASGMAFRHGPDNPLDVDVLLVDEASMVDLSLMTRLVEALPPSARLVLLGDRDQLASVEAGAVLGDIGRGPGGEPVVAPRSVVHLTRNYRFAPGSGIEELTRRINAGDVDGSLALLDDETRPEVRLVEPGEGKAWGGALGDLITAGYESFLAQDSPAGKLQALDDFRILCAHRHGTDGAVALNAEAERLLGFEETGESSASAKPGRPLGITRNDYELELYNGDVGVVSLDPEAPGRGYRVFFQAPDGTARWLSPLSIGRAETVFATTVHKSQGSEFASVALVLPEEASPILSRELLYTGVSRARESVTIFAPRRVLAEAIVRRIERSSGLSEALWS